MIPPEKVSTPEFAADRAGEAAIATAIYLGTAVLASSIAVRFDSGVESMSGGVLAGIALTRSITYANRSIKYHRRAKEIRAKEDRSIERYDR